MTYEVVHGAEQPRPGEPAEVSDAVDKRDARTADPRLDLHGEAEKQNRASFHDVNLRRKWHGESDKNKGELGN